MNTERKSDGGVSSSNWFCKIFRRNPKPKPEPEKLWWEDDWKKVRDLYPVGRQFAYLGRKMVVAQYKWDFVFFGIYGQSPPPQPYLVAEYADDKGVLREWCFNVKMTPLLLQNIDSTKK
jgi:hypothetical protein